MAKKFVITLASMAILLVIAGTANVFAASWSGSDSSVFGSGRTISWSWIHQNIDVNINDGASWSNSWGNDCSQEIHAYGRCEWVPPYAYADQGSYTTGSSLKYEGQGSTSYTSATLSTTIRGFPYQGSTGMNLRHGYRSAATGTDYWTGYQNDQTFS